MISMNGKYAGKSIAKPRFQIVQKIVSDHSLVILLSNINLFSNIKFIIFEFSLSSVA